MPGLRHWIGVGEIELKEGPHAEKARLDSERLLLYTLGRDRAWLIANLKRGLSTEQTKRFSELIDRRQKGEPIQYITGETEFYGLPIRVTPAVLIPRPETEHLVEKVIAQCGGLEQPRIVDVGTGSGAIAVALAHELPKAQVTATDISPEALAVAHGNAERNGVAHRVRFAHGDLMAPVSGERFDVVASNPPYVSSDERGMLDVEVREYEPETALFAGPDGLDIYRRLIPQAAAGLVAGGHIVLEIGQGQQQAIADLLAGSGFDRIEFLSDLQGIPRVASAARAPDA